MGFRIPVDEWLRGPLRARLDGHLRRGPLVEAGIIDPAGAARLLRESDAGRSHGATLWNLLMLAEWFARFGGRARW
jgi:asparagine synthase (glutamine-hydrolysing)